VGVETVDLERGVTSLTGGSLASFSGAEGGAGGAEAALDLGGESTGGGLDEDEERRWNGGGDCLSPVDFAGS
jgi:hypothetical protein